MQDVSTDARLDPDPEEPLGIEYVLSAAAEQGHAVRLFTPLDAPLHCSGELIKQFRPDVLAVSVYTPHMPATLSITAEVKGALPDVLVVVGGPHPTAELACVLHPQIDVAVIGEGEASFCDLVSALEQGRDLNTVNGIAFAIENQVVITSQRKRIVDLDSLPYPVYERRYYNIQGGSVSFPPMSKVIYSPMLFSRGCNMPCRFCSSRQLWGGEVYSRSPENVVAEMKYLRDAYGINFIFFEDLAFTLKRKTFLKLCKLLQEQNLGIHWGCETHVNAVTSSELTAMREAGCTKIIWGVENLNETILHWIKKKQTSADISRTLATSADRGILNWGCYIIGFPWENEKDILDTTANLNSMDIHQLRVSIATPFPGSQWHKEMPKSQLHPDLSLYDTNHLVYEHPTISPERMKELQNEVFIRFYRSPKYYERVVKMTNRFPHLRESFDEFLAYIDSQIELLETGQKDITQVYTLDKFAGRKVPT